MNDKADRETERAQERPEREEPRGDRREGPTGKGARDDKRKLSDAARKMRAMFEK
ncbi:MULTISPECIES: hypothetical protein [Actinomadura]|uniref:Uncharacterized protein n=1 Tax=Actinomadura litoris TaxID=2678616 RepID=A0A7K1KXZ9_9ACTN|nr:MULTISPECIES: hypothetical protein [Actinomadura]MBT2209152.1 hypothetical protein [Actinomadura sp. NEAU-AAG7]MUN37039.1 hypothetical protein [Actinomadura litoris]